MLVQLPEAGAQHFLSDLLAVLSGVRTVRENLGLHNGHKTVLLANSSVFG